MQARCYLDDALSRAVQLGMLEEARQLVKRGADPNGMAGGRLPLQRALCRNLEYDALPMVTMLLDAGADPSRTDVVFGGTALHTAALHSVAATRLLLERGADCRIRDKQRRSALFSAALHGCPQTVDLLLGAGANPNDADENGLTPLHVAACNSDPSVARLLLARGADPNVPDEQGNHALHKAAAEGSPATIAALIDGGADVNASDARGHSPLHVATLSALYSISASDRIAALLEGGADASQKDPQGATAICELASKPHLLLSSHCFLSILGLLLGAGARLADVPTYGLCPTLRDALCRLCRGCVAEEDTHPVPLSEGCIRQLLRGYTSRLMRKIP